MSSTPLQPTIALDPSNHWTVESNALVEDGNTTVATGSGKLVLKTMDNRGSVPSSNDVIGFEAIIRAKRVDSPYQYDSFTDTAGTNLRSHDGETQCDWQKPYTAGNPADLKINSSGRLYYSFQNEDGFTTNGSEHFTSNYTPPTADYAIEATIYSASSTSDTVEFYLRASLPYTFYAAQFSQGDSTWRVRKQIGGSSTSLGSWAMSGGIPPGESCDLRFEASGSILKLYVDGVLVLSMSDSSIASGFVGLRIDPGFGGGPGGPILEIGVAMPDVGTPGGSYGYRSGTLVDEGIQIDRLSVLPVNPDTIRIGFSKDGSSFHGTAKTLLLGASLSTTTLGTPSDLWGDTWAPSDVHPDIFSILVERTFANSAPYVDFARAIIHHTGSGGTFTMGYRETTRQRIQYGYETTLGSAVTASKRLRAVNIVPQSNPEFKEHRPAGEKLVSEEIMTKEWSTASLSGIPCYNELGVLASLMFGLPTTTGTLNQRQDHFFRFENRGEQKGRSLTCEYGEDPSTIDIYATGSQTFNRGSRVKGLNLAQLGIELSRGDAQISGNAFGHRMVLDYVMSTGANTRQTLTVTATGGSIKARFNGSAWVTIVVPLANAAAVDTAFEAITTIGTGSLTCAGSGPFTIDFTGASFAGKPQPLIEIDATNATGGTVTIASTTQGGVSEYPIVPIVPEHVNIYLADSYAALSSNRMTRCSMANFSLTDRFSPFWAFNRGTGGNFLDKAEGTGIGARVAIKAHADSEATSLLGTARSNLRKFIRIEAVGPTAYGSDKYEFVFDAAVKVAAVGSFEDEDGMYMANYELALTEDRAWGNAMTLWLKNMMTSTDYQ